MLGREDRKMINFIGKMTNNIAIYKYTTIGKP